MKTLPLARALGPAPTAEETLGTLLRMQGLLERVMQPHFAQFGISAAQWGVLHALRRAEQSGEPGLRLVDLGERLLIRPPSVTGLVGRMERAGLLTRVHCVGDQRARLARLTGEGRRLVERMLVKHQAQQHQVMSVLSPEERARLQQLLSRLSVHCEGLARTTAAEPAELH